MILLASISSVLLDTFLLLVAILAPFVVFAVIIHWLEHLIFVRLAERFGWKVVLWTGWLGTPIHELSHAVMCKLFNHRIDEIALFEPDLQSGRLGFVRHSFRRGNWFEEVGNFFIGIAPLIGGSIALAILLWIFFPGAATQAVKLTSEGATPGIDFGIVSSALTVLREIVTLENVFTVRFWVFIYLVLCVGGHMAPSGSDYQGATRGVLMVGGALALVAFTVAAMQIDLSTSIGQIASLLTPLFALLLLTLVLCSLGAAVVFLITSFIPATRRWR